MEELKKIGPEDRIKEFEDIPKCIEKICSLIREDPDAFTSGHELKCPDGVVFNIHLIDDEFYVVMTDADGVQKKTMSVEEMTEYMMLQYLLTNEGLEILSDAVLRLGEQKVFKLSDATTLVITPTKENDVIAEFYSEK